ncbi:MAG: DUF2357 domain-containing protein [Bacteroidales bacterium]|nr:DUF2357 domain-containing protein [Bacteroidales bacterium]
MELIRITHKDKDFTLTIECSHFWQEWQKGVRNIGDTRLTSTYSWTEGIEKVERTNEEESRTVEIIADNPNEKAFFFEQTDYSIWVEFNNDVTEACFDSPRSDVNEHFSWKKKQHILMGFLNYGNDIGRADLPLLYTINGVPKRFVFSYDVISAKLDYHHDWKPILEDIEREYRMLSLDYLKRTYHGISEGEGESYDIVWWNVFHNLQEKFTRATRNIIERPRHRLKTISTYKRADQIRHLNPLLEQQFAEHRTEETRLYLVEEQQHTHNTVENRFLKHALSIIQKRYSELADRVLNFKIPLSDSVCGQIRHSEEELKHLLNNPFFRTVGSFEGLKQESLVLQRDTNYSTIYRTYFILRKSFSLNDGMFRMETKDIATLYEIWCFIEVSHIVREQLGIDETEVNHRNRMEMNGLFTWELGRGEQSRILFTKDGVELAELVYNPKQTDKENNSISIRNLVVPTVPQKPDIVLQLTKDDVEKGMKMTYLFDAKYRISGKERGVDTPPDDAINQMHRYRDAIYYRDYDSKQLKKEVIGGYILFPGDGDSTEVQMSKFYKSIQEVNIGAFPLRPKNEENRKLLEDFIKKLIETKSSVTISKVIPQKGTSVFVPNRVLIGLVSPSSRKDYNKNFENSEADIYYTGAKFPSTIALHDLHFFVPYFKERGVRDVYEITKIRTIKGSEAKQFNPDEEHPDDIRLAFHLRFHHRLSEQFLKINTTEMINYTFIDTDFEQLEKLWIPNFSSKL